MNKNLIEVVPYKNEWPEQFKAEAKLIQRALGDNCLAVHHIGSTSVPSLVAKPIIDMLPVVKDILLVDQVTQAMEQIGYEAKGEYGIPFRRYFQKGNIQRTHNVHIFEEGNSEIARHVKFRDWMREHEDDREAYGRLKTELALKFPYDIKSYSLGKDAFIANIDSKAGFDGLRIVRALTDREWEAARRFRQQYIFNKTPVLDPCTWTFEHKDHVHFILYKGINIIGYAHIQLWPENRAALRIIVIEEPYRNRGIGGELLKSCERWLLYQGIKKLHIQSPPEACKFYCKHQYTPMPFDDPDGHKSDASDIEIAKLLLS